MLRHLETLARDRGWAQLYLDTNSALAEAVALYDHLGYRRIERYNDNPDAELFFCKDLALTAPAPGIDRRRQVFALMRMVRPLLGSPQDHADVPRLECPHPGTRRLWSVPATRKRAQCHRPIAVMADPMERRPRPIRSTSVRWRE
jgi:hypothetical protein